MIKVSEVAVIAAAALLTAGMAYAVTGPGQSRDAPATVRIGGVTPSPPAPEHERP
jgi:hypothetical protein